MSLSAGIVRTRRADFVDSPARMAEGSGKAERQRNSEMLRQLVKASTHRSSNLSCGMVMYGTTRDVPRSIERLSAFMPEEEGRMD